MGGPLTLIRFCRLRLKSKKPKGGLFGDKKNFRKKSHSAEKNRKGGPFSPVRFCRLRVKNKNPKGPLWNKLDAFPGICLVSFS